MPSARGYHLRRLGPLAALAVLGVAGGAIAIAQTVPTPARKRALHEPMPGPHQKKPGQGRVLGEEPRAGKNPTAFTSGDKVLPEPALDQQPPKGEPIFGDKGMATDRQTEDSPDRQTSADPTLHYVAVFNPDVVPFKRLSALDVVREDYTMGVGRTTQVELPVGGKTDRTRDAFWGSIQIRLSPGQDIAIPSVAPDMRILSYETEPRAQLVFTKDGADNFYVHTDDPGANGVYRLVFLADADAGYFAPSLPTSQRYTVRAVRDRVPAELRRDVPAGIRNAAKRTLDEIGIDEEMELGSAFNKLVGFFRAFSAKPLPSGTGDVYRDLCDNQAGVCRHRSFAFMVTANALGLPTRYVTNEAHAFVEVWFPERGWQRIDLGGAALRLEVSNAKDKTLHRPRAEDPFEKPREYTSGGTSYSNLKGDKISGLSDQQLRDKHKPVGDAPASGDFADPSAPPDPDADPDSISPDPSAPARTLDPKKRNPKIRIHRADGVAYRGETLSVAGAVEIDDKPLVDHIVDVFLAPAGRFGNNPIRIGRTTTGPDGKFEVEVDLPGNLELRSYELFVTTPEDATYNGAVSE